MIARAVACLAVLMLAACGARSDENADPEVWRAKADELYAQASALEGEPLSAEPYAEAAVHYRGAFRLEDPIAERAPQRALLAFRIARSMARAARVNPVHMYSEYRARDALFWLDQAHAINPAMRQVWFEKARVLESPPRVTRDLAGARSAYERYLADAERAEALPPSETERVAHARKRIEAITADLGPEPN